MHVTSQIAILYAGTKGYLDDIDISKINKYEQELAQHLETNNQSILNLIMETGKLDEQNEGELKKALESFSNTFNS